MGRVAPCARPQIATAATLFRGELVAGEHPVSILGTRVLRTEDPRFLTTGGVYTEDVVDDRLAGAYHLFFVRSPIAHAKITAIDASAALEAPGVVAVFTGADLAAPAAPQGDDQPGDGADRAGHRHGPVRGRGRGRRAHPRALPGRGRHRAGQRGLRPAARGDRIRGRPGRRHSAVRVGRQQRGRHLRRPRQAASRPVRRLRGGGQPDDRQPAGRPGADGEPGRGRRLGRGRAADRLDPQPGRPGHQGRAGPAARRGPGPDPGHHPGRGRRVRGQVRRRPRARRDRRGPLARWPIRSGGPRPGSRTWSR